MLAPEFASATCKKRFVDTSILSEPCGNGKLRICKPTYGTSGDHSGKISDNKRGLRSGRLPASGGIAKGTLQS